MLLLEHPAPVLPQEHQRLGARNPSAAVVCDADMPVPSGGFVQFILGGQRSQISIQKQGFSGRFTGVLGRGERDAVCLCHVTDGAPLQVTLTYQGALLFRQPVDCIAHRLH